MKSPQRLRTYRSPVLLALLSILLLGTACSDERGGEPGDAVGDAADSEETRTDSEGGPPVGDADAGPDTLVPENSFAYLVVEPEVLDFGSHTIGAVVTADLELENAGNHPLTLTRIYRVQGNEVFSTNVEQALVPPGEKKIIKVTFYALEQGAFVDLLRFESNAVNDGRLDVPLSAVATEAVCQDMDQDGHGVGCAAGGDCNDSDDTIYVGAPELCNNIDEDCDGLHDEDFVGLRSSCDIGFGACVTEGFRICAPDQASLMCSVNPVTGGDELCNELDDDCDGATDENFPSKGDLCAVGEGACKRVDKFICSADKTALICNVNPGEPGPEICDDGIDNDCDGITDEGDLEICGDEIDNDCDGVTDESGNTWGELFFARNHYSETVALYPSNGDGTFADTVTLDFPAGEDGTVDRYGVLGVGDFDGDRYLDLAVIETDIDGKTICSTAADCSSAQRCWAGICQALCTTDAQCPGEERCIDWNPTNTASTDVFCTPSRSVYMARSSCDGDGGIALTHLFDFAPGERGGPIADTDGNGHLDFVGLHPWQGTTGFVWLNDGQGGFTKKTPAFSFAPWASHGSYNGFDWIWGLTRSAKDMNGDGHIDLLGRTMSSGGSPPTVMWIFVGHGDGTFDPPTTLSASAPRPSNLVTANDFDGDGDQDIVAGLDDDGQPGGSWMLLNRNSAEGTSWVNAYEVFDLAPTYNSGGEHPGTGNGTSYDFDGDKQPDVLAAWVPEECGSYVWGCTAIRDPAHVCFGGLCRKIALIRNRTNNACHPGTTCIDGACTAGCTADCTGKACGSDGCGGTCGVCGGGQLCNADGACVVDCEPRCDGRVCGDNGCGGTCGQCPQGDSCVQGQCISGCVPNCNGRQCGDDGCGGKCAVFGDPEVLEFNANPATNVSAPENVQPTQPALAIEPAAPTTDDPLTCAIATASYDLDPVTYRYRWFRDGVFAKDLGERAVVPAALTLPGDTWTCRVRATDGIEWSVPAEAEATVAQ